MSNSSPTKKRKANDGRAATDGAHGMSKGSNNDGGGFLSSWLGYFSGRRDGSSSALPTNENNTALLNRMERMMTRMEEKLATVSRLESRYEELERKCSSLETILESTSRMEKTLKYHEMLIQNQKWEYSAPLYRTNELLNVYPEVSVAEADYIYRTSQLLKEKAEALRRGDLPDHDVHVMGDTGIHFDIDPDEDIHIDDESLYPHWAEFAAALRQFKPAFDVLPDGCDTFITFSNFRVDLVVTQMIKAAVTNMPFKKVCFRCNLDGGMSMILEMMNSNKCLQKLEFQSIQDIMDRQNIDELATAIHFHPSLVNVKLSECFGNGLGNVMLASLLTNNDLKLEALSMPGNHLLGSQPGVDNLCEQLSNYLASNPRLEHLDLDRNLLNDNDASLIANALRSNTTLRCLSLKGNHISRSGADLIFCALYDESSLNSAADSNHSCFIVYTDHGADMVNDRELLEENRAKKIYTILSTRNKSISNAQHFGDIDIKLLPNMMEAVQKYSDMLSDFEKPKHAKALSIVYEIMQRWDKVSPLYKTLGKPLG